MHTLVSKIKKFLGYKPFQDMVGIDTVFLPKEVYDILHCSFLIDKGNNIYGGGFLSVKRKGSRIDVVSAYPVPYDVYDEPSINFLKVWSSDWFRSFEERLLCFDEKIGFEYYNVIRQLSTEELLERHKKQLNYGTLIKVSPFVKGSTARPLLAEMFVVSNKGVNNGPLVFAYAPETAQITDNDRFPKQRKNKALEIVVY